MIYLQAIRQNNDVVTVKVNLARAFDVKQVSLAFPGRCRVDSGLLDTV